MGHVCTLCVRQWAAICVGESENVLGLAAADSIIPSGIRRRMGKLERLAVRCTLGLLATGATSELIFASRYGNIETLGTMFATILAGEPMSPMAFSGSVHNAAPGLVSQIRSDTIPHTALAAGPNTFAAGLVEAYTRLAAEECEDVVMTFADLPLPALYRDFEEEDGPGLALSLRLAAGHDDGPAVLPGRLGVLSVLAALQAGQSSLSVGTAPWSTAQ